MAKTIRKKDVSFQSAFDELEFIVRRFEDGNLDLDQSLTLYERGLELAALCKKRLSHIENQIHEIDKKFQDDRLFEEMENA